MHYPFPESTFCWAVSITCPAFAHNGLVVIASSIFRIHSFWWAVFIVNHRRLGSPFGCLWAPPSSIFVGGACLGLPFWVPPLPPPPSGGPENEDTPGALWPRAPPPILPGVQKRGHPFGCFPPTLLFFFLNQNPSFLVCRPKLNSVGLN